jgi:hypothetical protein
MSERRIGVFFYGLFMDADVLRARQLAPVDVQFAVVSGFSLRIGRRASLVPDSAGEVHGVFMRLSHREIDQLYSDKSLAAYRPEAVDCVLASGSLAPALCFNLPEAPSPRERNPEYAGRLQELARRLGLPTSYIERIGEEP